jgi:hypothetical protein
MATRDGQPVTQGITPKTSKSGAGDESRTRDLNLGKVALYQLSYSRIAFLSRRFAVLLLLRRAVHQRNEIM